MSAEDRSKRAETVRPQLDERCGERECDSVCRVRQNDENDEELNGEDPVPILLNPWCR